MSGSDARALSRSLLDLCRMRKLTIATAESCTGGLVAGALTDIPGSSDVIDRGFVTYSNDAKRAMLGVKATTLATFGAVSKETATAMAMALVRTAASSIFRSLPRLRLWPCPWWSECAMRAAALRRPLHPSRRIAGRRVRAAAMACRP